MVSAGVTYLIRNRINLWKISDRPTEQKWYGLRFNYIILI